MNSRALATCFAHWQHPTAALELHCTAVGHLAYARWRAGGAARLDPALNDVAWCSLRSRVLTWPVLALCSPFIDYLTCKLGFAAACSSRRIGSLPYLESGEAPVGTKGVTTSIDPHLMAEPMMCGAMTHMGVGYLKCSIRTSLKPAPSTTRHVSLRRARCDPRRGSGGPPPDSTTQLLLACLLARQHGLATWERDR